MKLPTCFFLFLSFFFISNSSVSQIKKTSFVIKDSLRYNFSTKNIKTEKELTEKLQQHGYYFFNTTKSTKDSILTHTVHLGPKTNIVCIKSTSSQLQKLIKSKKHTYCTTPNNILALLKNLTSEYDKTGKSFTEVQLVNQHLKNDTLFCELRVKETRTRKINKTVLKGYTKFPKSFLKHYIVTKKPFSKEKLKTIEDKIKQLPFVKNTKQPAVLFTKDSTHLYLYLKKIKANKLDALLGFSNQEGESKLKFNGHIDLALTNTLHKGETLLFKWNNTGDDQQEINLLLDKPYIFKSPINAAYNLNIFRQDSTFVNTKQQLSIGYKPHYKHTINTYYKTESSTTLDNNDALNKNFTKSVFGFNYLYQKINNWRIPKVRVEFDMSTGNKKTDTNTQQQTFSSNLIYNFEITPNNHIYTQNRNGYLKSPNKTNNELYRTGGATTLRGFLEQSIVSHLYNYTNIEYRYFNNPISYLYLFSDLGYFKNLNQETNLLSFGLGYTLGTPSGLLKISYAVGKNQNTDFNLANGLFHINFVTIF